MTSAADVLNVARSYLGTVEAPPHSNRTIIGEKFGWNGVAWCAEGFTIIQHEAGNNAFQGSASCIQLVGRYQDGTNGEWGVDPQPGDEGFLGSNGGEHTFTVERNNGDGTITCIDCNWRDSVCRVVRNVGNVYGFGRPNYDGPAAPDLPPPSATAGRPWLRRGSIGLAVAAEQQFLNAFVNASLTVDGVFGQATENAVNWLQGGHGLTVDGVVGASTYAVQDAMIAYVTAMSAPAPPPPSAPAFPGTVRLGSVGDAVTLNQARLRDRGWKIDVDGVFGHATEAVVRGFQQRKSLPVDGIIGPQTWVAEWTLPPG